VSARRHQERGAERRPCLSLFLVQRSLTEYLGESHWTRMLGIRNCIRGLVLRAMMGPQSVTFFVPGIPRPGGSKRGFVIPKTKRVIITEDCKRSKDWKTAVAFAAHAQILNPFEGALKLEITFMFPRPKGHFGTGKNAGILRYTAPCFPHVRPDATKLVRSTEDALKGIAWLDDSQIVDQHAMKVYTLDAPLTRQPGAWIKVEVLA